MARRGRKPLALAHVGQLEGSAHAKKRLTTLLSTLQSDCTIQEACQRLQLSESHFHALRHAWLQQALALLEPRAPGRKPTPVDPGSQREDVLQQQVRDLQRELALARARCEVLEVTAGSAEPCLKKGAPGS